MFTGAHGSREPVNRCLVNVRASNYQENGAAVRCLFEKRHLSKLTVFYPSKAWIWAWTIRSLSALMD
jgi:hypothetical protein